MGKGLGGSSQLNFMLHTKGIKRDFDNWEKIGGKEWNYITLKKYLNRLDDDTIDQDELICRRHNDEYEYGLHQVK